MANTSSAKKAQRVALRRRVFNARRESSMKSALKDMSKLVAAKSTKEAAVMLPTLYKAVDKAVKNHTLHRNTAARMKSRAAKQLAKLSV